LYISYKKLFNLKDIKNSTQEEPRSILNLKSPEILNLPKNESGNILQRNESGNKQNIKKNNSEKKLYKKEEQDEKNKIINNLLELIFKTDRGKSLSNDSFMSKKTIVAIDRLLKEFALCFSPPPNQDFFIYWSLSKLDEEVERKIWSRYNVSIIALNEVEKFTKDINNENPSWSDDVLKIDIETKKRYFGILYVKCIEIYFHLINNEVVYDSLKDYGNAIIREELFGCIVRKAGFSFLNMHNYIKSKINA